MANDDLVFTGITKRQWSGLVLIWTAILLLFIFLYANARRSVLNEIRHQAMGVAIAVASAIDPADIEEVYSPEDAEKESFKRVANFLSEVEEKNPDIRYIYTMRRSPEDGKRETDYTFVIDGNTRDENGDGIIQRDEMAEPPGVPYDAAKHPALINAWQRPDADADIEPDPPYPDLMSGYAPIKNDLGQTVAIVGVDITATTVSKKLMTLRGVMIIVWVILSLLILLVVQLYYQQREAYDKNRELGVELVGRNEMLRAANSQLAHRNKQYKRELKLAQSIQTGFLPSKFPRRDKIIFDKYYLTCEMLGGDIYDVFTLDDDHVGMYVADVAGHGASAALVSGLLKMAVTAVRDHHAAMTGELNANLLEPGRTLTMLNKMLMKEIPDYEFVTMIYAVYDIPRYTFSMSSAGHPPPFKYDPRSKKVVKLDVPTGAALGLLQDSTYEVAEKLVRDGEKIVFFSDGVTEALDESGELFGEERFSDILLKHGMQDTGEIITALTTALEEHRGAREPGDDYSVLVAEIR